MSYKGMNAATGRSLDGIEHIRQSVQKILTTLTGTRVMRREFGSVVPLLIDRPLNDVTRQQVIAATFTAAIRWEPRIRPDRVQLLQGTEASAPEVDLTATRRDGPAAGQRINIAIPLA